MFEICECVCDSAVLQERESHDSALCIAIVTIPRYAAKRESWLRSMQQSESHDSALCSKARVTTPRYLAYHRVNASLFCKSSSFKNVSNWNTVRYFVSVQNLKFGKSINLSHMRSGYSMCQDWGDLDWVVLWEKKKLKIENLLKLSIEKSILDFFTNFHVYWSKLEWRFVASVQGMYSFSNLLMEGKKRVNNLMAASLERFFCCYKKIW
jgi:hypothetical protein